MVKKILKNKILILASCILVFCLLPLTGVKNVSSQEEVRCREIPLGSTVQRLQEIRDILIGETFLMKQKFEEMFPHSREITELVWQCRAFPYPCRPCPPGTYEKIDQEFEEVKKLNDVVQERAEKLRPLIEEAKDLRKKIGEMEEALKNRNPEEEVVLDCFTARRRYVEKEECLINDYYICKIQWE